MCRNGGGNFFSKRAHRSVFFSSFFYFETTLSPKINKIKKKTLMSTRNFVADPNNNLNRQYIALELLFENVHYNVV